MRYSDNYNLKLPQRGVDRANVDDLDDNFEVIDGALADDRQISLLMYDSTATYNTGAIRGYENPTTHRVRAYRCLEDNVTGPWDATKWAQTTLAAEIENSGGGGGSSTFAGLSDVSLSNLQNGQVPQYNSTSGKWENANSTGGASELSDLDDVSLTTPTEGQILTYDGDEWVNADAPDVDVTKTASGNPIEVSDSASAPLVKCVTAITGSQDLHGYDKPWVGGAGKNKLDTILSDIKALNSTGTWTGNNYSLNGIVFSILTDNANNVIGIKATGTASANSALVICNNPGLIEETNYIMMGCPAGGSDSKYRLSYSNNVDSEYADYGSSVQITEFSHSYQFRTIRITIFNGYSIPTNGIVFYPMIRLSTVSDATFEPYSNICPITAYDEGEIEVRGKNLSPNKTYQFNTQNVFFGIEESSDLPYRLSPGTYTFSFSTTQSTYQLRYSINNGTSINVTSNTPSFSFTLTEESNVSIWVNRTGGIAKTDITSFQLELGSTATTYEPYTSTTHTTTYPSAIYRGSEDVVNGSVESDWVKVTLSSSDNIVRNSDHSFYIIPSVSAKANGEIISDKFLSADTANVDCVFININWAIRFNTLDAYTTADDFKAHFMPIEIAYELATPTTTPVTPTNLPIKSLNGYSHIESTTGEMEIEYITGKYNPIIEIAEREIKTIDEMLTENIELSMVASQNYTTGELIIACGKIYRATANIASGSSLTVGTNVVKTTIEDEIARSGGGVNYSTTEHVVGTWIDGSPVYEKVYEFSSTFTMANGNQWYNTSFSRGDIDLLIDIVGVQNGGAVYSGLIAGFDSGYISLLTYRYTDLDAFILRYTKSS